MPDPIKIADGEVPAGATVYDASTDTCRRMVAVDRAHWHVVGRDPGRQATRLVRAGKVFGSLHAAMEFRRAANIDAIRRAESSVERGRKRLAKLLARENGPMIHPMKTVRVVATSDLHGNLPEIPPCDVLLLAGDITPATNHDVGFQARWLDGPFRAWLDRVPAARVVGVAGNHDFVFQQRPDLVPAGLRWTYLQDSGCDVCGLSVFGTPWQPFFGRWAFNAPEEDGERFLAERFAGIPDDVDVVVCHGPPAGYGDVTSRGDATGSTALRHHLDRVRPRLAVFGHIHEGFGRWDVDGRTMANVSLVDEQYRPANRPVVFDLAVPALPRRVVLDRDAGTVTDARVTISGTGGTLTVGDVTVPTQSFEVSRVEVRKLPPEAK